MQDLFLYNKPIRKRIGVCYNKPIRKRIGVCYNKPAREACRRLLLSSIADGEKIDYNIEKQLSKKLCE